MKRRRHTPEQVIRKLAEADKLRARERPSRRPVDICEGSVATSPSRTCAPAPVPRGTNEPCELTPDPPNTQSVTESTLGRAGICSKPAHQRPNLLPTSARIRRSGLERRGRRLALILTRRRSSGELRTLRAKDMSEVRASESRITLSDRKRPLAALSC